MKRMLAALLLVPCLAVAQNHPAGPVRIIVPYPPGGATDVMARVVAQKPGASGDFKPGGARRP